MLLLVLYSLSGILKAQDEDFNKMVEKIFAGDVEGLTELLDSGIDVNIVSSNGVTPLILASSFKDSFEVVKCLVEAGAGINVTGNRDGRSPLIWAAGVSKETTEYLLEKGADPDIIGNDGTTAVINAVFGIFGGGSFDILDLLIDNGADVNRTLVNGASNGYTAISYAARNGNPELVSYLIDKGAEINHKTTEGNTPLMLAAEEGEVKVLEILLGADADISLKNNSGLTALEIAESEGHDEIISLLKQQ